MNEDKDRDMMQMNAIEYTLYKLNEYEWISEREMAIERGFERRNMGEVARQREREWMQREMERDRPWWREGRAMEREDKDVG